MPIGQIERQKLVMTEHSPATATLPRCWWRSRCSHGYTSVRQTGCFEAALDTRRAKTFGIDSNDRYMDLDYASAVQATDCNGRDCCLLHRNNVRQLCALNGQSH